MWFVALLAAATPAAGALDEPAAAAQLEALRAEFPRRPKEQSLAALERLATEAPARGATSIRARLWLGDLARQSGDRRRAATWYAQAADAAASAPAADAAASAPAADAAASAPAADAAMRELARLAERGLGDVALGEHRYAAALRHYDAALATRTDAALAARDEPSATLRAELVQKRALAVRLRHRFWLALAAWILFAAAVVAFIATARARRASAYAPPLEVAYVAPVYALLVAGCVGRDGDVLRALVVFAVGSLVLLWSWALRPRGLARAALLATAHVALFYAAVHFAGIVDSLMATVGGAGNNIG
jgi:hypothetical protein